MAPNLFAKAKGAGPAKTATKQKEEVVINDKAFHTVLHRLVEVNRDLDTLKAESTVLSAEARERGIEAFTKLYKSKGKYPGSFLITATGAKALKDANFMFIPVDKYITIDEERYSELIEIYGESVVEEKTTYELDATLVEKYGEVISDLIMGSKKIPDDVKQKLISAKTSYSVKKGTIEEIQDIASRKKMTVSSVIDDIRPIWQIKNVKLKE